jgi:hypothetical protein
MGSVKASNVVRALRESRQVIHVATTGPQMVEDGARSREPMEALAAL